MDVIGKIIVIWMILLIPLGLVRLIFLEKENVLKITDYLLIVWGVVFSITLTIGVLLS